MGEATRIKKEREAAQPKVMATISINILDNGDVTVSGPIQDPIMVMDTFSKAFAALTQFYVQNKGVEPKRILQQVRPSSLILPGGN